MSLDKEVGTVTLRTQLRRGYQYEDTRKEARAMMMLADAFADLSFDAQKRVLMWAAMRFGHAFSDSGQWVKVR